MAFRHAHEYLRLRLTVCPFGRHIHRTKRKPGHRGTFATAEECEAWQKALEECGYETEIVKCYKKGNDRYHVKGSSWTIGYDYSDIINALPYEYIWRDTDILTVDEYVRDWFDSESDEYEGWYKDLILERAEALKDALHNDITSTGCIVTDYELDIIDTLVDDKPIMGFFDKHNNIEYRFGLKIYGA